ncbi:MAG: alpha-1,4-glucan--maltose-1-phosphate maltosyltransferase [Bacteroidota bacterium]|nr:alpha-1,4-glucan--maltose-1-phosphate maltosyltransferase [Bacteroidota bacterium]
MIDFQGKQRIIITNVSPELNCGKYPIKRVIGEKIVVSADVFGDGHDVVKAAMLCRQLGNEKWEEIPMKFLGNDRWEASFIPTKMAKYEYTIRGWVDHFATWQHALKKKYEANQDISTEILVGAQLMEEALPGAKPTQAKQLHSVTRKLKNSNGQSAVSDGLTDEITSLMYQLGDRSNASTYSKLLKVDVERKKALFSTWYELFPRSTAQEQGKHGTFKDCERLLPMIADMGFDVLYFPPIHPIGRKHRKGLNNSVTANPGDPGSPWAIGAKEGGHKSIHPELGSLKDFTALVKKAKQLDIEIALDIALQCAPDHPYVKSHPQWFKWRPDGTVQYAENPPKKYQDILPINFECDDWENLWQELKSIFIYWIDKGVTIFRVDNPHTKPFPFWEWVIREVRNEHPEIIFLAEAFTRPRIMEELGKIGFNQSYTYFTWRETQQELVSYVNELTKTDKSNYYRPNFWPNTPDILPGHLVTGGEVMHIIRVILAATLSSNYGLYGPVYEFGVNQPMPGKEEYIDNEKYEVKHWDWNRTSRIKEVIKLVNQIRKDNPALQQTNNISFGTSENPEIICYGKTIDDFSNQMIVVVNLDPYNLQRTMVKIPLMELGIPYDKPYWVHDQINGSRYQWLGEWNYVELNPHIMPVHIFKVEHTA